MKFITQVIYFTLCVIIINELCLTSDSSLYFTFWKNSLNAGTFQALRYQPTNTLQSAYTGPGEIATPESQSVHAIGVKMSNDASFHAHITKMATTCRRLAG